MSRLALLLSLGAARATTDPTCATLWSKLTRLGCDKPRDDLDLRDHLDTLPLADGRVVNLRCDRDYSVCFRAAIDVLSATPSSPTPVPMPAPPSLPSTIWAQATDQYSHPRELLTG